ncbi:unnamed protein product [Orchesella dallaii]|uniref:Uncharacterized protein n=1 Tax=Orchesella dallaii TaxID=48710 RepID=A0ABP1RHT3_9HEXA
MVPVMSYIDIPQPRMCVMKVLQQKNNFSISDQFDLNSFIGEVQSIPLSPQDLEITGIDFLPHGIGNLSTNFFTILANILDQSFLHSSDLNKYPNYRIIWGIATLILVGAYKGKMFSYLSKNSALNWPENIGELVNGDYTTVTLKTSYTIHEGLMVSVGSFLQSMIHQRNITNLTSEYELLGKQVIHYEKSENVFLSNVIAAPAHKRNLKFKPSHLAIVDVSSCIVRLKRACMVLAKEKSVSDPKDINGLASTTVWTAYRNFFKQFFSNGLVQLLESGILMRWDENYALAESFALINDVNRTANELYNVSMEFILPSKFFIRYMKGDTTKGFVKAVPEALPIIVFKNLFIIFGILMTISVLLQLLENLNVRL